MLMMSNNKDSNKYLVKEIVKEITDAGHIPAEYSDRFEEDLLRDVEHAVDRFRIGMVGTINRGIAIRELTAA